MRNTVILLTAFLLLAGCAATSNGSTASAPSSDPYVEKLTFTASPTMIFKSDVIDEKKLREYMGQMQSFAMILDRRYSPSDHDPAGKKDQSLCTTVCLLSDSVQVDRIASEYPGFVDYHGVRANWEEAFILAHWKRPWPEIRDDLTVALARLQVWKLSSKFPAWLAEGLTLYISSGEFSGGYFAPKSLTARKIDQLASLAEKSGLPSSRELASKPASAMTDLDRRTSEAIIWWFMESTSENRKSFQQFFNLLRLGRKTGEDFSELIGGRFDKLDEAWRKWIKSVKQRSEKKD